MTNRWLLPVALTAIVMYGFDLNVVNVAIPSLQHDLGAGQAASELVVAGYAFTYAAGLVTGGRLGDLLGYRRMFLGGLAAFVVTSVLCGLAMTSGQLVLGRLLQGLAAAMMVPQVLAMITSSFTGEARTRALAWFGVSGAVSSVLGQGLGGLLLVANLFGLGWRAVFFLNLPLGLLVYVLAARVLPRTTSQRRAALDPIGVVAVSGALALALVPLLLGREQGWTWVLLVAAIPAMVLALAYERRLADRGSAPLVDLALFRLRTFSAGLGVSIAFMAHFTSTVFVASLLLQNGLGLTPLQAGLTFGPMALAGVFVPLLGRRLITRYGTSAVIWAGCAVDGVAALLLAVLLGTRGSEIGAGALAIGLGLIGLGNTLIMPSYLGATLSAVRPDQAGVASGTLNTTQQFAGSAGLAAVGAAFFAVLGDTPDPARYADAAALTLWIDLGLVLAMATLTALLPRTRARVPQPAR